MNNHKKLPMGIIVAGLPTNRTQRTLVNTQEALSEINAKFKLECIDDARQMKEVGAIYTPSVIVNNKLKVAGRIPSVYEITTWVEKELQDIV